MIMIVIVIMIFSPVHFPAIFDDSAPVTGAEAAEAPAFTASVPMGFVTAMMHWAMPGPHGPFPWVFGIGTTGKTTGKHIQYTENLET